MQFKRMMGFTQGWSVVTDYLPAKEHTCRFVFYDKLSGNILRKISQAGCLKPFEKVVLGKRLVL